MPTLPNLPIIIASLLTFASALPNIDVKEGRGVSSTTRSGPNDEASAAGKLYFGTATDNVEWNDTAYLDILDDIHMFGQITPRKAMKWVETEPERGVYTFAQGDETVQFAKSSGKILRGHNCVWYNSLPDWVTDTTWTASELTEVVQEHCFNIVHRWRGKMYSWDVINEPFNDDGTWRETLWYKTLDATYIPLALRAARAADPRTKLYINEYNITGTGPKATSMKKLVRDLKRAGVPLDGVGIQAHEAVGEVPTDIRRNLEEFVALGVEVAITELDVRFSTLPPDEAGIKQQRKDYETIIAACAEVKGCVGVTVWDFTDKYSWIPGTFPGEGDASPWDENLQKKPAYYGIVDGFAKAQ
ncbi:endo-beta-1,4-glucanase [Pilatotrama ljubarskyi]|nr:endo-beta-1,4-glucanase [Pilatotrama ljubarskyi]